MWDQGPVSRMFLIPMWHPVLIADLTPEWTPQTAFAERFQRVMNLHEKT